MSTIKTTNITHGSNTGTSNLVLGSDGSVTFAGGSATGTEKGRNLMINGAFNVAQRGTSSTSGGYQTVDRWQLNDNNTNTTITQSQHALTSGDTGPWAKGFRNSYSTALSSAGNSLDASSYCQLKYMVEAQDIACSGWDYTSASSYITFSFWFKCSTNQTFHARWESYDGTAQNYPFSFTATGNNTWTKITKAIPGNSNITVNNDNGAGLGLSISLFSGTDRTGTVTLDQWGAFSGSARHPDDANTWITAGASTFEITGVQLELGAAASEFEHRTYAEELQRCSRYYWKALANNNEFFPNMGMADTDGNTVILNTQFPVRMRDAPSALEQTGTASDYKIRRSTTATCTSVPAFGHATVDQAATNFIKSSHGFGDGSAVRCMGGATDAYLAWSAEL